MSISVSQVSFGNGVYVVEPKAPKPLFFMCSLSKCWVGWRKRLMDTHEACYFSTWLLRAPSVVDALWCIYNIGTHIFIDCVQSEISIHICFLDFLVTSILMLFLLSLRSFSQTVNNCQWINVELYFWPSLTVNKMDNKRSIKHLLEPGTMTGKKLAGGW